MPGPTGHGGWSSRPRPTSAGRSWRTSSFPGAARRRRLPRPGSRGGAPSSSSTTASTWSISARSSARCFSSSAPRFRFSPPAASRWELPARFAGRWRRSPNPTRSTCSRLAPGWWNLLSSWRPRIARRFPRYVSESTGCRLRSRWRPRGSISCQRRSCWRTSTTGGACWRPVRARRRSDSRR